LFDKPHVHGTTENVGVENAARLKTRGWKTGSGKRDTRMQGFWCYVHHSRIRHSRGLAFSAPHVHVCSS